MELADAYEPNPGAPGRDLTAMAGDSGSRSVGSTYHNDLDVDWFAIEVLERSKPGRVRVSWTLIGALGIGVSANCRFDDVIACEGAYLRVSANLGHGECFADPNAGSSFVVTCGETWARPSSLSISLGHQRWTRTGGNNGPQVPAPGTTCKPEFTVSYAPADN